MHFRGDGLYPTLHSLLTVAKAMLVEARTKQRVFGLREKNAHYAPTTVCHLLDPGFSELCLCHYERFGAK